MDYTMQWEGKKVSNEQTHKYVLKIVLSVMNKMKARWRPLGTVREGILQRWYLSPQPEDEKEPALRAEGRVFWEERMVHEKVL